ncbi:pyridine nucleotide transhydrogenase [Castellaniella defragrans]|uniref:pyridine nucleotide transhydrogenase n=1 Tax=Castellaniella defragrans TaxID=75697 RepID=UPI002AFDDDA8|nr:pyridine nucleotide transhydrogenase [Castellaniella defragrans]
MRLENTSLRSALIGHTGFVGTTLLRQHAFSACYHSRTIHEIDHQAFDLAVCAAAPAQKWLANRQPEQDRERIQNLIGHLRTLTCRHFILISTVDVFADPSGVDEDSPVDTDGLHPYGLHRRALEIFVEEHFPDSLIVRLPGLVGPGLRKNIIYDFLHQNNLAAIESRNQFQFYPMVNLWHDLMTVHTHRLRRAHLTAEPLSVAEVARLGFGRSFEQTLPAPPVRYDMQTRHAALFGASGRYQYRRQDSLLAIRAYAQSEPPR